MTLKKSLTLSLVIPAYNEESHLKECLDAIASQSVMPAEVIVVDNNSTDATAAVAGAYPFVTLITEPRQGIVFARNAGFNQAQGQILARIDADTALPADWVAQVQALAAGLPTEDAMTGPCTFRNAMLPRLAFAFHRVIYFWTSRLLFGHRILFGSNMFLFRSQWLQIRDDVCLTNSIHEDMDVAHHLAQAGGKIHFEPKLQASISNRRFHNWSRYPFMWVYSRLIHVRRRRDR